jgi:hypothetical protein
MLNRPNTDIWTIAIVAAPIEAALMPDFFTRHRIVFGPPLKPFQFLADPFGLWRDDALHVFAEFFDYRDKIGRVDVLRYDRGLQLIDRATALRRPFHLSYPYLIETEGEVFLLPEAHRSGKLTAYRATHFPHAWTPAFDLLDLPAIDATPYQIADGAWRMLFTLPGVGAMRQTHLATAPRFSGPWRVEHGAIHDNTATGRPGGTVFRHGARLIAPMQDCTATYGGAINLVDVAPDGGDWRAISRLSPGLWAGPFQDGLHTLSAAGPVTLIDVKRGMRSWRRWLIDAERRVRRLSPV